MSIRLAQLVAKQKGKKFSRQQCLALVPQPVYEDGMTKQSYKDECDINKIMARFADTDTITHLAKHQGSYADFSDFDFFEQTRQLTRGREIFDDLDAEIRREFGQSPAAFFAHVNDPENAKLPDFGIKALLKPGNQLPAELASADLAAKAAASEPPASEPPSPDPEPEPKT